MSETIKVQATGAGYSNLFTGVTPVTHRCPKCQKTNADVGLFMVGMSNNTVTYCLACFAEWVGRHVPVMEPIPAE